MKKMTNLASPARIVSTTVVAATLAGSFMLPVAPSAEAQDALDAAAASIPGSQQLPDTDKLMETAKKEALNSPLVNNALNTINDTPEPATEESTNPTCAPIVLVAVPGTFETNRDHDPNEPVGALGELTEPARSKMGGQLSETYINYAADAGVSGTAYAQSIQNGATKTLKTIEDVQERCDGSRVFLTGFSQGADVAGDVATMIGQKQTNVRPETMAGVVLFSDPSRTENTNLIAGTAEPVPHLPGSDGQEVSSEDDEESLGQQLSGMLTNGLSQSLMDGSLDEDGEQKADESETSATSTPAQAGEESKPKTSEKATESEEPSSSEKPTESVENKALDGNQVKQTGGISLATDDNVSVLAADAGALLVAAGDEDSEDGEEQEEVVENSAVDVQNMVSDLYRDGKCGTLTFIDCYVEYLDDPESIESNTDVVNVPESLPEGNIIETSCVNSRVEECNFIESESSLPHVPTPEPADDTQSINDGGAAESDNSGEPTEESSVEDEEADSTGEEKEDDSTSPSNGGTVNEVPQRGNAGGTDESDTSDSVSAPQAGDTTGQNSSDDDSDKDAGDEDEVEDQGAGSESKPSDEKKSVAAGEESKPTTSEESPQAGEESKPTETSEQPTSSEETTSKKSEQEQAGGQSRGSSDSKDEGDNESGPVGKGEPLKELEQITMSAVAGGGVAGQREEDFGLMSGAVVSMCVPGDIVCSLPENSQLARDLVDVGEKVTTNIGGVAKEALAGNTRMGGLMAVEATNTVFSLSGLPPLKLSADSIMAIVSLVAGAAMIHSGDVTGQGAALVAATIPQLPEVLPELYEQVKDLPAIIEALPDAGDNFARNLGLDQILNRLSDGYKAAGINDLTDVAKMPTAAIGASIDILNDNAGLMEMATNPDYLKVGAHSAQGFRSTIITEEGTNAGDWYGDYLAAVGSRVEA